MDLCPSGGFAGMTVQRRGRFSEVSICTPVSDQPGSSLTKVFAIIYLTQ
jgi:hypothetical protein